MEVIISKHAGKRLKERNGLNKSAMKRMVQKAYDEGIRHNETTGRLNKWITSEYFKSATHVDIRLYGDKAFLFDKQAVLITVIQLPQNLVKDLKKMTKSRQKLIE